MTYDEGLAGRVRGALDHLHGVSEKRMFGGLAFMVRGHLAVGVVKDELMLRVGPEACAYLIGKPHARTMDFTGRTRDGFLYVDPGGLEVDHDLAHWLGHAVEHALSLPPKSALEDLAPQKPPTSKRLGSAPSRSRSLKTPPRKAAGKKKAARPPGRKR